MRLRWLLFVGALLATAAAPSNTISRGEWMKGMKTALPTAFCKDGMYFRECFQVTQEVCEKTALSATRVCLESMKDDIPEALKQPEDGQLWGTKVGACAGNGYEATLVAKRIKSDKCNDAAAWVPKKDKEKEKQ
jgi:hypothetical protein